MRIDPPPSFRDDVADQQPGVIRVRGPGHGNRHVRAVGDKGLLPGHGDKPATRRGKQVAPVCRQSLTVAAKAFVALAPAGDLVRIGDLFCRCV